MRESENSVGTSSDGGWYHTPDPAWKPPDREPATSTPQTPEDRKALTRRLFWAQRDRDAVDWIPTLARERRIAPESLTRLGAGVDLRKHEVLIPTFNADREVTGISRRCLRSGRKMMIHGSRHGLFMPEDLEGSGVLVVTEGATDTAAALDLDFEAVGVVSANSGPAFRYAVDLIQKSTYTSIVIMADREDGGVGLKSSEALARKVLEETALVDVRVVQPPEEFKDLSAWKVEGYAIRDDVLEVIDAADGWEPTPVMSELSYVSDPALGPVPGSGPSATWKTYRKSDTGASGRCPTPFKIPARRKGTSTHTWLPVDCGRWSCAPCRAKKLADLEATIRPHLEAEEHVYQVPIHGLKYTSLTRKIRRHGGWCIRIQVPGKLHHVVTNVADIGGTEIPLENRITALRELLRASGQFLGSRTRPVVVPLAWTRKPAEIRKAAAEPEYIVIGRIHQDADPEKVAAAVVSVAKRHGVHAELLGGGRFELDPLHPLYTLVLRCAGIRLSKDAAPDQEERALLGQAPRTRRAAA